MVVSSMIILIESETPWFILDAAKDVATHQPLLLLLLLNSWVAAISNKTIYLICKLTAKYENETRDSGV